MKKIFVFFSAIFIILLIVASKYNTTSESIENLAYVIAIGIDSGNNNLIKLTLQIATPSSSGSDSSEQSSEATTTTVECSNINSGLNMVNSYISKKINLSHCKIIVFSEEFASNGINDEISTLATHVEIRPACSVAISKCDAKDFIEMTKPVLVTLTARFYEVVVNSGNYTGYSTNVNLLDFYKSLKDYCSQPVAILAGINVPSTQSIPDNVNYIDLDSSYSAGNALIENKNSMQISGLAVFNNGYYIGELDSMDSICHLILKNELQNAMISIPDPFNSTELINLSLNQLEKPDISVKLVNGSPYISCNIKLKANINSLVSNSDFSTKENLNIICEYANSYLSYHINNYLYKTSKELKSDTVGFGRYLLSSFSTLPDWYNQDWISNYQNSFFDISVDTTITNSNLILKN